MPSAMSTPEASKPHIPAWKRLGLKLKYAQDTSPPISVSEVASPIIRDSELPKRKRDDGESLETPRTKKPKKASNLKDQSHSATTTGHSPIIPLLQRKKSVTFTSETKTEDGDSIKQLFNDWVAFQQFIDPSFDPKSSGPAFETPEPSQIEEYVDPTLDETERHEERVKKPKKEKVKSPKALKSTKTSKSDKIVKPTSKVLDPAFTYLKQYYSSKDTWKFNKVYQIHLLKHAFDIEKIPSEYIELLYLYIAGLKGGARTQLRDAAIAVKVKDQEEVTEGTPEEMANLKKKEAEFEAELKEHVAAMTALEAGPNIGYEEGVLLGLSDYAMKARMAKRMRADRILEELAYGGGQVEASGFNAATVGVEDDESQKKRLKINEEPAQPAARRKRKQRTAAVDDSSSSSDSSSSDDDSTDDDSEDDNGAGGSQRPEETVADDTSSSSSSSSSSEDSDTGDDNQDPESGDDSSDSD
jgi:hypothetical protein